MRGQSLSSVWPMSKIEWEYDLVERPFCEQLKAMGWQWIEGDTSVPDFTERVWVLAPRAATAPVDKS